MAAQANDPHLSPVPSLLVVAAAAPAECFAVKPVAQVDKPVPSFGPPAVTVDLAAASDAAALLAPSVDAAGYVDVASSTAHCHCEPYPAAVDDVSTNHPAPAEPSPCVNTAMPAGYVPSATAAQWFVAPSSFLGSNCRL